MFLLQQGFFPGFEQLTLSLYLPGKQREREFQNQFYWQLFPLDYLSWFQNYPGRENPGPDIFNHNVEIVLRLYEKVSPQAEYELALGVLEYIKKLDSKIYTKSGLMVGLGEKEEELISVMKDLRVIDCDIITIDQYLQSQGAFICC